MEGGDGWAGGREKRKGSGGGGYEKGHIVFVLKRTTNSLASSIWIECVDHDIKIQTADRPAAFVCFFPCL